MTKATTKKVNHEKTPLELAEATLQTFEQKRSRLAAKRAEDDREVEVISYQLHTGDQDARQRYEVIRDRALKREIDLKTIDAAIVTAKAKVLEAKTNERAEAERKLAEEAREVTDRIDELFASADKHLAMAFDALKAADGRIEQLHGLGFDFPTANHVRLNASFALMTYLMALPKYWFNELQHSGVRFLAPGERRTFSQFWARMVEPLARNINAKLQPNTTEVA